MANEKLIQAGRDAGVNHGDVAVLERVGLTPGVVEQAVAKGWSIKDIWELYQQFGPSIIAFLTSLFSRGKEARPEPVATRREKKPKPEETDDD